ncbi:uncharacterized protein LOC130645943 [Hydractinia symbiolongicarpus]|uniref:uncharacterized protein LOC130645943 n=1 Tax=Hydractinia symbiolongicarpus TaxID=13093 RepID=UPI00254A0AD4|nr:uncharacterized protein LOC130645943 [Hydractinia symbiolongicarpus]
MLTLAQYTDIIKKLTHARKWGISGYQRHQRISDVTPCNIGCVVNGENLVDRIPPNKWKDKRYVIGYLVQGTAIDKDSQTYSRGVGSALQHKCEERTVSGTTSTRNILIAPSTVNPSRCKSMQIKQSLMLLRRSKLKKRRQPTQRR